MTFTANVLTSAVAAYVTGLRPFGLASAHTRLSGFHSTTRGLRPGSRWSGRTHPCSPLRANRTVAVAVAVLRVKPLHRSQFHSSLCLFADATDQTSLSADAGLVWQFAAVNATNTRSTVEISMRNWNRNASGWPIRGCGGIWARRICESLDPRASEVLADTDPT